MIHMMLEFDERLSAQLRAVRMSKQAQRLTRLVTHSGDYWLWALASILIWLKGNEVWSVWAALVFIGLAILLAVVTPIKFLVRRPRPSDKRDTLYHKADPHSFPSGHAARVSMIAMLSYYLAPPWIALLALGWAGLVSVIRIALGVHYLSDVLVGMFLGVVVGLLLTLVVRLSTVWPAANQIILR